MKKESIFSIPERLDIYKRAKEIYQINNYSGMCRAIIHIIQIKYNYNYSYTSAFENLKTNFPEFYKLKPFYRNKKRFWWNIYNRKIRIKNFDKLINKLSKYEDI